MVCGAGSTLPTFLPAAGLAPSSLAGYRRRCWRFHKWITSRGSSTASALLDPTGTLFLLFLRESMEQNRAASTVRGIAAAIISLWQPLWADLPAYKSLLTELKSASARKSKHRKKRIRLHWLLRSSICVLTQPSVPLHVARDRALILVGFFGALRVGELLALRRDDIRFRVVNGVETIKLRIRFSKTDQQGKGDRVWLVSRPDPICPVAALVWWTNLTPAGTSAKSPLFSHPSLPEANYELVVRLVKSLAQEAGHDPAHYSTHSLRHGGLSWLSLQGALPVMVQRHARHKSPASTETYIELPTSAFVTTCRA